MSEANEVDGEILQKGVLPLNLDPQKTAVVVIPYIKPEIKGGVEYRLQISFHQKPGQIVVSEELIRMVRSVLVPLVIPVTLSQKHRHVNQKLAQSAT